MGLQSGCCGKASTFLPILWFNLHKMPVKFALMIKLGCKYTFYVLRGIGHTCLQSSSGLGSIPSPAPSTSVKHCSVAYIGSQNWQVKYAKLMANPLQNKLLLYVFWFWLLGGNKETNKVKFPSDMACPCAFIAELQQSDPLPF